MLHDVSCTLVMDTGVVTIYKKQIHYLGGMRTSLHHHFANVSLVLGVHQNSGSISRILDIKYSDVRIVKETKFQTL